MNSVKLAKKFASLTQEQRDHFLLNALSNGDLLTIEIAILSGANLEMYRNYPLKRAIEKDWPEIVQMLVDEGVDVTQNYNEALELAHQLTGRDEIIKILERAGAHLD